MNSIKPLYSDKLVDLFSDRLVLKSYYFPLGNSKQIQLTDISSIEILLPSITTGKYRIWGSGNLSTWFPLDSGRGRRDKIFHISLSSQKIKVSFTVEHSAEFELLLRNIQVIK